MNISKLIWTFEKWIRNENYDLKLTEHFDIYVRYS